MQLTSIPENEIIKNVITIIIITIIVAITHTSREKETGKVHFARVTGRIDRTSIKASPKNSTRTASNTVVNSARFSGNGQEINKILN